MNDVHYSLDFINFEEVLLENLAKIYSSNTFTFHSNFLVPFHSNFWKGIFFLKAQRSWNLYIFNREILTSQQFDSDIFSNLLSECEFNSIELDKNQYKHEMQNLMRTHEDLLKRIQELEQIQQPDITMNPTVHPPNISVNPIVHPPNITLNHNLQK